MLEYNLDDADALLSRNLDAATKSLATVEEDLGFLRDQTTTTEVSILGPQQSIIYFYYLLLFIIRDSIYKVTSPCQIRLKVIFSSHNTGISEEHNYQDES